MCQNFVNDFFEKNILKYIINYIIRNVNLRIIILIIIAYGTFLKSAR